MRKRQIIEILKLAGPLALNVVIIILENTGKLTMKAVIR